jgi:hypothetical protein
MVRGDEAGHHDRSGAIDDFGVARRDRWCDLGNPLPVDEDVSLFEVPHSWIEAQHDAAAQKNSTLPSVADQALEICWRRRTQVVQLSGSTRVLSDPLRQPAAGIAAAASPAVPALMKSRLFIAPVEPIAPLAPFAPFAPFAPISPDTDRDFVTRPIEIGQAHADA